MRKAYLIQALILLLLLTINIFFMAKIVYGAEIVEPVNEKIVQRKIKECLEKTEEKQVQCLETVKIKILNEEDDVVFDRVRNWFWFGVWSLLLLGVFWRYIKDMF